MFCAGLLVYLYPCVIISLFFITFSNWSIFISSFVQPLLSICHFPYRVHFLSSNLASFWYLSFTWRSLKPAPSPPIYSKLNWTCRPLQQLPHDNIHQPASVSLQTISQRRVFPAHLLQTHSLASFPKERITIHTRTHQTRRPM